jgi:hypothetical protein
MDHGAAAALDHLRDQEAIQANGRQQIQIESIPTPRSSIGANES